jgi:hypothetical protein
MGFAFAQPILQLLWEELSEQSVSWWRDRLAKAQTAGDIILAFPNAGAGGRS